MQQNATQLRLKYSHTVGLVAMEGRGFSNPVDVAISSDAKMYVISRTNAEQPYGIRIGICDLDSEYYGDFGEYGDADGAFVWPTAVAFDSQDRLYLADEANHRITIFDKEGKFLDKFGTQGTIPGRLNGPAGLAISRDIVYVSDHLNHRIQAFTTAGRRVAGWGHFGDGARQLNLPWGITVSPEGRVYVADWRNDRIQKYNTEGGSKGSYGESGEGHGQFHRPSSVAVDEDGYMYVADWGNERVQVLDPEGNFVQMLRGESTLSKWAQDFFEANDDEAAAREKSTIYPVMTEEVDTPYEESARTEPYFWGPVSVKLDTQGRLYVVETNRHRIQVYERVT